jgi:steroid delta-isomerase-like uncharacterized protein
MTIQDNAAIAHISMEAWNNRDFSQAASYMTEDVEWQNVATGDTFRGLDGYRRLLQFWATAIPDGKVEIVNEMFAGDWVITECIGRGTQTGPLARPNLQLPPTGQPVEVQFCRIMHIRDGKIDRARIYLDTGALKLRQRTA